MKLDPKWEYVSDQVMGGLSQGQITREIIGDDEVVRLTGAVSLENNGGFVQMAFDLASDGASIDASGWTGLELGLRGNGEVYDLRLRTAQLARPWQSFRTSFAAPQEWAVMKFPFETFEPHRTDVAFDVTALRRVGILGIGRRFAADVSVKSIAFYV